MPNGIQEADGSTPLRLRLRVALGTAVPFSSIYENGPPEGGPFFYLFLRNYN